MAPTIVFDLDGTLVDTAEDLVAALNFVLAGEGIAPVTVQSALGMIGSGARVMIERAHVAAGRPVTDAGLDAMLKAFLAHYDEHIADHSRPYPGTVAALDRFRDAGWTLAVCTNKTERPARLLLRLVELDGYFATISGQDTYGVRKPDPRHLTETILTAGGDPANAIMVGDSRTDVETAVAANIPVVAVSFGYGPFLDTPPPTRLIDRYDDLFDAVASIRNGR